MIDRINSLLPSPQKDMSLRNGNVDEKTKSKKELGKIDHVPTEDAVEDDVIVPPANIRFIGKNLDLIA